MALPHPSEVTTVTSANPSKLRLGTTHDVAREHPAFTDPGIRALVHRAEQNGLDEHIYRIGRRVLIDLDGFQTWVRGKQGRRTR